MQYAGFIKQSLKDYPGKIAAVLFSQGCNFSCPFCHNGDLVIKSTKLEQTALDITDLIDFLQERKGFLDAVVFSGGEPTLHDAIIHDIRLVKDLGYLVKLDTNGTNPQIIEKLLEEKLLDYVAMDIKAPLDFKKYQKACGKLTSQQFFNLRNSIHLLRNSGIEVEFRTTIVPGLHSEEDVVEIARYLKGCSKYTLQQFNPRFTLNSDYGSITPYRQKQLEQMADKAASYVQKIQLINI